MGLRTWYGSVGLLVLSGWMSVLAAEAKSPAPPADQAKASNPRLIQPADLEYRGAFRLPGPTDETGWAWGGWAITYYPDGDRGGPDDGYPGSIFGVGNEQKSHVSEISIPRPVISPGKKVEDLKTAKELQPFTDIRAGNFKDYEMYRVGLAYLPKQGKQTTGKLYFCWGQHMEEGQTGPSHGWCELNLSKPDIAGPWSIEDCWHYVTTDYMFEIPQAWAQTNTPGMLLATGRFRDGGQGAQGPALYAIGPWNEGNPPAPRTKLKAVCLLKYAPVDEEGGSTLKDYHHSDEWGGGAWLTAGEKSAVIFVGTKGLGKCWYGFANGVVWPDNPPFPPIPAAPNNDRGWWSDRFQAQMIFYDPDDLAAVSKGKMKPGAPQPYACLRLDDRLFSVKSDKQKHRVGDVCFDRERGLLYMFELRADEDKPIIHVWSLSKAARTAPVRSGASRVR